MQCKVLSKSNKVKLKTVFDNEELVIVILCSLAKENETEKCQEISSQILKLTSSHIFPSLILLLLFQLCNAKFLQLEKIIFNGHSYSHRKSFMRTNVIKSLSKKSLHYKYVPTLLLKLQRHQKMNMLCFLSVYS